MISTHLTIFVAKINNYFKTTSILISRGNTSRDAKEVNPHLFQTVYVRLGKMETSFQSFYSRKMGLFLKG
jgi:hypothetical protein